MFRLAIIDDEVLDGRCFGLIFLWLVAAISSTCTAYSASSALSAVVLTSRSNPLPPRGGPPARALLILHDDSSLFNNNVKAIPAFLAQALGGLSLMRRARH